MCRGVCQSYGEYVCVSASACAYTLVGECVSHETLGGDAGSSILCGAAPAAELLRVCGSRLPVQNAPGPGCDSTRHSVEQR